MKHSSVRNTVERTFGLLKVWWTILRGRSYYLIKIQCRIILACCLLHNLIRSEMALDPLEHTALEDNDIDSEDVDYYTHIEKSNAWTTWKDNVAREIFELWQGNWHAWMFSTFYFWCYDNLCFWLFNFIWGCITLTMFVVYVFFIFMSELFLFLSLCLNYLFIYLRVYILTFCRKYNERWFSNIN